MKIVAMLGAAALAVTSFAAASPADAQRYGWHDGPRDGPGWDRGRDRDRGRHWDEERHWDRGRDWDRDRGWDRGRGWHDGRGYGRSRVVCRVQRGYYGPVRRCFRVYR